MGGLQTFDVPKAVQGKWADYDLGCCMIRAWRSDGIFQVALNESQRRKAELAFEASRRFFRSPLESKARCVSDLSYSGYIASGEEVTAGVADFSEIFTVCQDVAIDDVRVRERWPCHGPVPWPGASYRDCIRDFMHELGNLGERLLRLVALGLHLDSDAMTKLTRDGWHHMRLLRFPALTPRSERGIGAHTDYGMLVIAAQDDVGGLYVRPPVEGERRSRNWLPGESSAGKYENEDPWNFVRPAPGVLTVFPGDILHFMTRGYLLSTPHKVRLNTRERFALAYFHDPNFESWIRPLTAPFDDPIHYGTHFTNMFARSYPDRATTQRIRDEDRWATLAWLRQRTLSQLR